MVPYIRETLKFLAQTDFKISYPVINHIVLKENGGHSIHMSLASNFSQNNQLNKNENLKFIIVFSMLDVFADVLNPHGEGKSFKKKYNFLPKSNDYEIIFSSLYRIAKIIRNAMVHNPEGLLFDEEKLDVNYQFRSTPFSLKMTRNSLDDFYTLIIMYVKGDLGKGEYFLALAREIYERILGGVESFSDDINPAALPVPVGTLKIKSVQREIVINPVYEIHNSTIVFAEYNSSFPQWAGADFSIELDNLKLLIPNEALDINNKIEVDIAKRDWLAINPFPPVPELL